jgi:hypothetical protein
MTAENTTNSLVFQIDQLLEEASKLAKTESDSSKFFDTLLQRAVLPVKAQSAAIWMLGPDSHPVAVSRYQSSGLRHHSEKTRQAIDQTIRESIESGQAKSWVLMERHRFRFSFVPTIQDPDHLTQRLPSTLLIELTGNWIPFTQASQKRLQRSQLNLPAGKIQRDRCPLAGQRSIPKLRLTGTGLSYFPTPCMRT